MTPLRLRREWYEDHQNLVALAYWLEHTGRLTSIAETIDFFERPWRWTGCWNDMNDRLAHAREVLGGEAA